MSGVSPISSYARRSTPDLLMAIGIGLSDGLLVPFALLAGMTAAGLRSAAILQYAIYVIPIAAVLMGVGGWLTRRSASLKPNNMLESEWDQAGRSKEDTRKFFQGLGLDEQMQEHAIAEMEKDDRTWAEFISRYDHDTISAEKTSPPFAGLLIGLSYLGAGLLLLLPFRQQEPMTALRTAGIITALMLVILGLMRSRILQVSALAEVAKLLITAAAAGTAAFMICRLIF